MHGLGGFKEQPHIETMEETCKNCQSCGMPMKKDPAGGGTNSDGTKSGMYCGFCYQNGAFISPNMTVKKMQELCKGKLKEMRFPGFIAWLLTRSIPNLKRWKKDSKCGCSCCR